MRRVVVAGACAALILAVSACGSSDDASPTTASPTPTPTPTPASVVWAGDVCVEMDRVKTSVAALGRNLSYDVTADRSALEQIQRQLTIQVLALGDAADALQSTLVEVPVDFVAANDMVVSLTKTGGDTKEAANAVGTHLQAATAADNVLGAAAEVGQALVAAKAAFEAGQSFVAAIGDATSTTNAQLREAFDAAPQCQAD